MGKFFVHQVAAERLEVHPASVVLVVTRCVVHAVAAHRHPLAVGRGQVAGLEQFHADELEPGEL